MAVNTEYVEERLRAYILPRAVSTEAQQAAFDAAVAAQIAYEEASGIGEIPGGVASFTIGDFSATLSEGARQPAYNRDTISPAAWAYLRNAGLIGYALPTAKKP